MSAEKAPLPFGYTFMAGERIPSTPDPSRREPRVLTMAAKQAPLPVFRKHVDQWPLDWSIDMLTFGHV
jgi:hypothetical protein